MKLTHKFLEALQQKLKVGNRNSVYLNAISKKSKSRFDLNRLQDIENSIPQNFLNELFSKSSFSFQITFKDANSSTNRQKLPDIAKGLDALINLAKDVEGEKGINPFGFGYPLLIRKNSDNKIIVAPLLIWTLRIQSSRKLNTWEIRKSKEDSVVLNEVFANHIESELKIKLETGLDNLMKRETLDKEKISKVCANIIYQINQESNLETLENQYYLEVGSCENIPTKKHFEKISIDSAYIYWGGLFSIFETTRQNIIKEYDILLKEEEQEISEVDFSNTSFQTISSIDTDPSQQRILNSLKSKKNIIIHGPPGTGKSQTLTAIIVNALENKKKVLVVCEKSTALDVLYKNLKDEKLESLLLLIKDSKKGRRIVVDKVHDIMNNRLSEDVNTLVSEELNSELVRVKELIREVNNVHKNISIPILGKKNWNTIVGEFLKNRNDIDTRPITLDFNSNQLKFYPDELRQINEILEKGEPLYFSAQPYLSNCIINQSKFLGSNPYQIEVDLRNDILEYKACILELRKLQNLFVKDARILLSKKYREKSNFMNMQISLIFDLCNKYFGDERFMNQNKTNSLIFQFMKNFSPKKRKLIHDQENCLEWYRDIFSFIREIKNFPFAPMVNIPPSKFRTEMDKLGNALNDWIAQSENFIDNEMFQIETNEDAIKLPSYLKSQIVLQKIQDRLLRDDWFGNSVLEIKSIPTFIEYLDELISKSEVLISNSAFEKLYQYINFTNDLGGINKKIIEALKGQDDWVQVFSFYYLYEVLARNYNSKNLVEEKVYQKLEQRIKKIKDYQSPMILNYWLGEQKNRVRIFDSKSDRKVKNLYNKRRSEKHPKKSLRLLIEEDIHLFQSFFPVVLTTPIVASTLFGEYQNAEPFDIVLFDEASQLKIEETLPALLKGNQKIISGDEHQMPPSNYFNSTNENIIQEELIMTLEEKYKTELGNDLLDSQSLLDLGIKLSFNDEYLRFHYRSEHHHLIDFSNKAFYNNSLFPMPSVLEETPIEFNQIIMESIRIKRTREK